jgi:hypothetical protein
VGVAVVVVVTLVVVVVGVVVVGVVVVVVVLGVVVVVLVLGVVVVVRVVVVVLGVVVGVGEVVVLGVVVGVGEVAVVVVAPGEGSWPQISLPASYSVMYGVLPSSDLASVSMDSFRSFSDQSFDVSSTGASILIITSFSQKSARPGNIFVPVKSISM